MLSSEHAFHMHLQSLAQYPRAQSGCSTALPYLALQPTTRPAHHQLQPHHNGAVAARSVALPKTFAGLMFCQACSLDVMLVVLLKIKHNLSSEKVQTASSTACLAEGADGLLHHACSLEASAQLQQHGVLIWQHSAELLHGWKILACKQSKAKAARVLCFVVVLTCLHSTVTLLALHRVLPTPILTLLPLNGSLMQDP